MSRGDLHRYVERALAAGLTADEAGKALHDAGWTEREVRVAVDAWAPHDPAQPGPPVPRPVPVATARDVFVYTLTFGALLVAALHLILLLHAIIDLALADPVAPAWGAETQVRWSIAVLVVAAPLYAWLARREARRTAEAPGRRRSPVRKWSTWLTLLLASAVFLADLVAAIYGLLSGDLTAKFALKAGAVGLVSGAVFLHHLRDAEREP